MRWMRGMRGMRGTRGREIREKEKWESEKKGKRKWGRLWGWVKLEIIGISEKRGKEEEEKGKRGIRVRREWRVMRGKCMFLFLWI